MKLNSKLVEALVNLRGNRDFDAVLEGMAEHEREELARCRDGDGPVLYRAQGAAKTLEYWREAYREAPTVLEKLKATQPLPKFVGRVNT